MQDVVFIEEGHQYFVKGTEYISATTLIDKYSQDFDAHFWSTYKAFESLLKQEYGDEVAHGHLSDLKKARELKGPGWFDWAMQVMNYEEVMLEQERQKILEMWARENQESRDKGSEYHLRKETEAKTRGYSINPFTNEHHWVKEPKDLDKLDIGYYPELIIYDIKYPVIGTADKVFVSDKGIVYIDDFKTNKEIKKSNMFQKMARPLEKLDDCNYNHYRLQIGLYAWMLERRGYQIKGISINHLGDHMKMRYSSIRGKVDSMVKHHFHGYRTYGFSEYLTR